MFNKIYCSGESTPFACQCLPENYDLYGRLDLTNDGKSMKMIVIWSIIALAVMIGAGAAFHPLKAAFDMPATRIFVSMVASAVGLAVYIMLHEGVHGIFIKLFTGTDPTYGMDLKKGVFYAASPWYFKKWPYIAVALAPVIVWGIVLAVLLADIEDSYFWYLYLIQIFNVTGAAGDLYVTCMVARMPKEILVSDGGAAMNFYMDKQKPLAKTGGL